jgi:hypothetical protein
MRVLIAAAVVALATVLAIWLALASMAFLWVLGFWLVYPWPDRLWMWARYATEAPPNAIVHRWLIISGIVAALPLVAIGVLVIAWRMRKPPGAAVYGRTGWATQAQMQAGGLSTDRRPF